MENEEGRGREIETITTISQNARTVTHNIMNFSLKAFLVYMMFLPVVSVAQDSLHQPDSPPGTVWFSRKSARLTKAARASLDSMLGSIQVDTSLDIQIITYAKDLCEKCGLLSWIRAERVSNYLTKKGVSGNRIIATNRIEGELNKVDLFLTFRQPKIMRAPVNKLRS